MDNLRSDVKQLKKEMQQIRIFCEAVADAHAQSAKLREILHKEMGFLIYKKSQPWYEDLSVLNQSVIKALQSFDKRLKAFENRG